MTDPKGINNLKHAFVDGDYDAVFCTFNVDEIMKLITSKEEEQGSNIKVGAVDCFSMENHDEINDEDSFGNPKIDYIAGKYASMGGPALRSCITQCPVIRRQTLTIQITTQFVCIRDSGMHRIKILSTSFTDIHRIFTKMHTAVQI